MWVLAGLGNPGRKYSRTRHNVGFMVIEEIAGRCGIDLEKKDRKYRIGRGHINGEDVILIEPLLYMNRSGIVIKDILSEFKIPPEKLIVIHDDLDSEIGRLRIRRKGSSGGHKGVESVIENIESKDFARLKIGIGRDPTMSSEDYVLSKFRKDDLPLVKAAVERAADAITSIIQDGLEKAMNVYNR
ncbi:MAG: aminoacyl-tRNA hydrolase [Nitrospirota bacterium]